MKQIISCLCCIVLLLGASHLCAESVLHVLAEGETLYGLSRKYDVPLALLIAVNRIQDPTNLAVGTGIRIPGSYRVEKGDTLYGIAVSNGISLQELLELNRLDQSQLLHPGDLLHIPGDTMTLASAKESDGSTDGSEVVRDSTATEIRPASTAGSTTEVDSTEESSLTEKPGRAGGVSETNGNATGKTNEVVRVAGEKPPLWPHAGERTALSGKLRGTQIRGTKGDAVVSVSSGVVVWIAPFYGYGEMVIVQADDSHTYTYAGNEKVMVSVGNRVSPGTVIGRLGVTPHEGDARVFFAVFKDGMPIDPEAAPRL
jgi:murein DD-endopeptidase MepM/ murein hydrolase activator NlpD